MNRVPGKIKNSSKTRHSAGERLAQLALLGELVFHADDLANLWNIRRRSTLRITLARYVAAGLLYRIYRGLYSIKSVSELDPYLIGLKALYGPSYISCESVLFDSGVINQPSLEITIMSGRSKRFMIAGHRYRSRRLPDIFLFNETGIEAKNGVRIASVARATADLLYCNPKKYLDAPSLVDWNAVTSIGNQLGYPLDMFKRYDDFTSKKRRNS